MSSAQPLEHYLSQIQSSLGLQQKCEQERNFHSQIEKMKQQLFNCDNTYIGDIARNVLLAKIRIDDVLQRAKALPQGPLATTQPDASLLTALEARLGHLNSDIDHLLREGILSLYMELCDLREKSARIKAGKIIQGLLRSIIEIAATLLKPFFIFQEYHRCKTTPAERKRNILSLRNLNTTNAKRVTPATDFDLKLMREVEEALSRKPVSELLEAYMKKEVREINETLEVCRICSYQIKLENMEKHVKVCQKKCQLKQLIDERNATIATLLEDLKNEFQMINEKTQRSEEEESLRRVAKLLLCSQKKKERNVIRRSSLVGVKSEKSFRDKFQQIIQEYEYDHGVHFILHRILQASRQKGHLQKRLNTLQINSLNSEQNDSQSPQLKSDADDKLESEDKPEEDEKEQEEGKSRKLKLAVSFEYDNNGSIRSSQFIPPFNSNSSDLSSHFLRDIPTKRSLRRSANEEVDFEDVCKHYVSLQDITFQEEEQLSVSLENFELLKFLGKGAFGKVYLVRRVQTGDLYALKVVRLEGYDGKQLEAVKNEHEIFKKIAGDHLVRAPFAFSEREAHMFVLQYLPGGDLRRMLNDEVYLEEPTGRFYLAEIVLAIEHLHKFNIIHRDLKPENLVMDRDGHLKLTDFGLSEFQIKAKLEKERRMSQKQAKDIRRRRMRRTGGIWGNANNVKLIGTPDYIAPEIISQVSINNYTIDWWSLGVMTYEMLIGARPFCGETIEDVVDNITNRRIQWPEVGYEEGMISPQAKDLIQQLLNTDFVNRLGANGAQQIKAHPFFNGIDWGNLKRSKPPVLPSGLANYTDLVEDKQLRQQVYRLVGSSNKLNKRLHLQRFVRFDLLGDETIETVQKLYEEKSSRIRKLKTIRKLELEISDSGGSRQSDQ